jgi:regulation of enolase protein 1 (concanavalin A-like superfamily)
MYVRAVVCRLALACAVVSVCLSGLASAQTSVPSPWAAADIGAPALAGNASASGNAFTINAAGVDIWGTADQFQFVYQQISGDVDVRARVDNVSYASSWSKAGVMIRSSLSAGAAHGYALVSAGKGVAFQRRPSGSSESSHTAGAYTTAPQWVRLVRSGTTLTAYSSTDGATWTTIGSDTIALGSTAYVGIAVTSHNASAVTTASVSNITLQQATSSSGLPAGQAARDIGSPAVAGRTTYSSGRYTISGAGADIWGTSDQFQYVYQQASGDIDVKVRVASISYADRWSKAGVMIRQSLSAGAAHGYALTSAGRGYAFQRRPAGGDISVNTAGSTGAPPGWVRLKRTGNLLTAYESVDGSRWTTIGTDTIVMSDPVYVGIAVTSHNPSAATTAVADSFAVTSVQSPGNQLPTVSLAASGAPFTAPATISLTASASDPENQMGRVEFYNGSSLLGTDTTAPYSLNWSNVAAGTYSLTAMAYDAAGQSAQSAPVSITVSSAANQAPTVSLTSPASGASFTAPASITISANASDPENQLARVDFYNGSTLLGSDTTAPYSFTWSNVAAGTYSLTAIARDAAGLTRQSAAVSVTVKSTTLPAPTGVTFQASADHATVTSYRVEVFAAGANTTTGTPVSSISVGKPAPNSSNDITVSISSFFTALGAGNYQLTVAAGSSTGSTRSTPVTFTK